MNINSIRSRHSFRSFRIAIVAAATMVLTPTIAVAQSSVIISEEFNWQARSVAQHTCKTYKHTLTGPGVLSIRTKMSPYSVRDLGMSTEDILTHDVGYFAESIGQTVNGMKGANIKEFIGKPVDRISRWKVDTNKYNVEFKVCNPVKCNLAGDCSQLQATASIVIDYAADGSGSEAVTPEPSSAMNRNNVTGVWVRKNGGKVIDRMEITPLGEGYKVELREGDNAPLYAIGFGVLHGDRIVVSTRNTSSGVSGLLVLTFSGQKVHYRSYYIDGRQSWDGDFLRQE